MQVINNHEHVKTLSAEQLMKSLFLQIKKTLSDFNELNQSIDIDESRETPSTK